jgi:hypothetical protein
MTDRQAWVAARDEEENDRPPLPGRDEKDVARRVARAGESRWRSTTISYFARNSCLSACQSWKTP